VHRLQFLTQALEHPSAAHLATLACLGAVFLAGAYLLSRIDVAWLLAAGIFLELFSGYWSLMGIPVPLDRMMLSVALLVLVLKGVRRVSARRVVLRPLHIAFLVAGTWALASAILAGTISQHLAYYALLDAFGLIPFAVFTMVPIFFGSPRQRNILLITLVVIGFYVGLTGALEGVHLYRFIFPRYIADPNVGIQFGRVRGPLLESSSDGFCIFVGGVAAAVALATWRRGWARKLCYLTIGLDGVAIFFTLTRSVWIGAFLGTVAAMSLNRTTRRILVPLLLAGTLAVGATLAVSSQVRTEVFGRVQSQSPVWDRENTDLAAIKIVKEKPLTGVGWGNFINVSGNYMWQQPGYPITGLDLEVHNIFLGNLANLGIHGFLLWLVAFAGAVWRGLWRRPRWRAGPEPSPRAVASQSEDVASQDVAGKGVGGEDLAWLEPWRLGGIAIVICFVVVANLAPLTEAPANLLLWTWLGVVAMPYTSRLRSTSRLPTEELAPSAPPALAEDGVGLRPVYL